MCRDKMVISIEDEQFVFDKEPYPSNYVYQS